MSNFTHHPHVDVEINPWVAASGFCAFNETEQAKFFQHIAEMTNQWKTGRVFQWESMCQEIWKTFREPAHRPYEEAKKLLEEWIEYMASHTRDPGNFWRDEVRRMEQINTTVRDQNGKLAGSNTILKDRVRVLENELAAQRSQPTIEESVRDANGEIATGATVPAAFHFKKVGDLERRVEELLNSNSALRKQLDAAKDRG